MPPDEELTLPFGALNLLFQAMVDSNDLPYYVVYLEVSAASYPLRYLSVDSRYYPDSNSTLARLAVDYVIDLEAGANLYQLTVLKETLSNHYRYI